MTAVQEQEADVVEAPEEIKQTNSSVEQEVKEDSKITLDATLTIQNVSALYEQMQVLLDEQEEIEIDASSVTSIDTSTLQLLVVLKQTAIKLHKKMSIDFPSDNFIEAAELLGLAEMLDVDQAAAGFF
jgi:ABC-type transporter Mla MlaB component